MKKSVKNKKQYTIITLILSIISLIFISTIAYSAFSSTMHITGIAHARVEANVRITDFRLATTNNATSTYEEFGKNHVISHIDLPSNSSTITYYLEITNYGTTDVGIYSISGLQSGVNYSLKDYKLKDKICDENGKCNTFIKKTYELVISTSNSTFTGDIQLNFEYRPFMKITYTNFDNSYLGEVIKGDSLSIDLSKDSPRYIDVVSESPIDYSFLNNILKLNNVTNNIEVIDISQFTYSKTGDVQTFTARVDGLYKIELWGASGGYYTSPVNNGKGGYTSGEIYLKKNTTFYVYVGGKGTATDKYNDNIAGGYNGGGICHSNCGSGGGATDIRLTSGNWNNFDSLKSRIMVASGGAGENNYTTDGYLKGGSAGGLIGGLTYSRLYNTIMIFGGTQTSGAKTIIENSQGELGKDGEFGIGGDAGEYGSGAGSGYYGGAGGLNQPLGDEPNNGGEINGSGGSSFISGHNGCDAITEISTKDNITHTGQSIHYSNYQFLNTIIIDGEGYNWTTEKAKEVIGMPTFDGTSTMTGNDNDGYAKITLQNKINIYDITYTDISGEYQKNILHGETLEVNFGNNAPNMVVALANGDTVSSNYQNGILTVPNVTNDLEIKSIETIYVYDYTGSAQEFKVPYTATYKVELWGASGGIGEKFQTEPIYNGKGGYVSGTIKLKQNQNLYVYVGGKGQDSQKTSSNGGYNGGGICYQDCGGGGGATDIRLTSGAWNDFNSLKSRIMVAGAGAGDNSYTTGGNLKGGHAGGLIGGTSYARMTNVIAIYGGTQTSGAKAIQLSTSGSLGEDGKFGVGGKAGSFGGGAGSGYYGGAGGVNQPTNTNNEQGGEINGSGGSSFISGHNGCDAIKESSTESNIVHTGQSIHYSGYKFTNTKMIDGEGYNWTIEKSDYVEGMPSYDGTTTIIGNNGNGYAKITLIEIN